MKTHSRRQILVALILTACWTLPSFAQGYGSSKPQPAASPSSTPGFVHAVYFWLRPDLSAEEREIFSKSLHSLLEIESVQHGWIGVPAATERPIIDRSYTYALTLVFADEAGHDAYQIDPIHDRFREVSDGFWERIMIYDSVGDVRKDEGEG